MYTKFQQPRGNNKKVLQKRDGRLKGRGYPIFFIFLKYFFTLSSTSKKYLVNILNPYHK